MSEVGTTQGFFVTSISRTSDPGSLRYDPANSPTGVDPLKLPQAFRQRLSRHLHGVSVGQEPHGALQHAQRLGGARRNHHRAHRARLTSLRLAAVQDKSLDSPFAVSPLYAMIFVTVF